MRTGVVCGVLLLASSAAAGAEQHWGPPSRTCRQGGVLQLSSVLRDIPAGKDWAEACQETPASWAGGRPPDRCPKGAFQYGEWDTEGCEVYREYRVCNGQTCTQRACSFATGKVYHKAYDCPFILGPLCATTGPSATTNQMVMDPPGRLISDRSRGCAAGRTPAF